MSKRVNILKFMSQIKIKSKEYRNYLLLYIFFYNYHARKYFV